MGYAVCQPVVKQADFIRYLGRRLPESSGNLFSADRKVILALERSCEMPRLADEVGTDSLGRVYGDLIAGYPALLTNEEGAVTHSIVFFGTGFAHLPLN